MNFKSLILKIFFLFIIISNSIIALGQKKFPTNYFRSPVNFHIFLSGTFGEIRKNHLHSGIDIKTQGRTGKKIYAAADGYISRIKISSRGFGKALYITHPNAFVSVYAHLEKFNKKINDYIIKEQYKRKSYSIDINVNPELFKVKKGEFIAFSGISGSSSGPHLHFEIRDEKTQLPINPLLFGLKVKDYIRPKIKLLKVYPVDPYSLVNGLHKAVEYNIAGWGPKYRLKSNDTINLSGNIAFGIQTYDVMNNVNNHDGVYFVELYVDTTIYYSYIMNTFSFDEKRYVNALIDYHEFIKDGKKIQQTYIAPNNKLSIYRNVKNNGIVNFNDDTLHKIFFIVKDVKGNTSKLTFMVRSCPVLKSDTVKTNLSIDLKNIFSYKKDNIFKTKDIRFYVPANALYDTLIFKYKVMDTIIKQSCSKVYQIHNEYTPLQKYCILSIKPDSIPERLRNKALIAKIDRQREFVSKGGEWDNGFVKTRIREFGNYFVMVDTVAPVIEPVNIYENKKLKKQKTIKIKIKDELSGIKSYKGTINGRWILMEYDAKNDLLTYYFDNRTKAGKNIFRLEVKDKKENIANYKADFVK